ncbi:hypothetical protein [Paenarthrobacter ureafaciens]|uniref:hypothetical protein n=1 Tax=Paenarthrobacter ureafaciens TaxID=37931 RepID=UPI001119BAF6|nr:hypothetical protein [Paenarthrobacter ureafaciens]GLU61401.1 hypothetical protein Pure01_39140 [Paenarthrobacter ureafaciens]GLU65653.1 hypothetical protein Pure02_39030 [Paenarthrobacter ureafaciens]GLU69966.1 hypothetical protein Pure03_39420 [Paenarthrobacter ureafaciens]GLU74213.1 hypothetical protein Pure04_39280 [Paenarthrobacter ureafaciens]GLU78472.1 hypothetical protein Pure05_39120 [Paenarthrobacter ureafaciens]
MVRRSSTAPARRGFPRWAWIVVAAVAVIALAGGVAAWYQANPETSSPAAAPSATSGVAATPNGCLAGKSNDATGLLKAQKEAPHSEAGAVGFAAAVQRWAAQYPRPTAKDGSTVAAAILAKGATGTISNMAANIAAAKPFPGVTSASLNLADGRYFIEESTPDMVRVTVGGAEIINGKPTDRKFASTVTIVWEADVWKIRNDGTERTVDDLFATGSAFSGGC